MRDPTQKDEIRGPGMAARAAAIQYGAHQSRSGFEFRRFLRRLRFPLRETMDIEQAAARNRIERLFEVNFRTWTR